MTEGVGGMGENGEIQWTDEECQCALIHRTRGLAPKLTSNLLGSMDHVSSMPEYSNVSAQALLSSSHAHTAQLTNHY